MSWSFVTDVIIGICRKGDIDDLLDLYEDVTHTKYGKLNRSPKLELTGEFMGGDLIAIGVILKSGMELGENCSIDISDIEALRKSIYEDFLEDFPMLNITLDEIKLHVISRTV